MLLKVSRILLKHRSNLFSDGVLLICGRKDMVSPECITVQLSKIKRPKGKEIRRNPKRVKNTLKK